MRDICDANALPHASLPAPLTGPHEHDRATDSHRGMASRIRTPPRRLGRHPLPERGGHDPGVREPRIGSCSRARSSTARSSSSTTARTTAAVRWPPRPGQLVVHEPERGYGSAYLAGLAAARGRYIVMADADLTYDFAEIPRFLAALDAGADVVIGNRMQQHPPRRDAVASPLHRQPAALGLPEPAVPTPASTTPTAGCGRVRRDVLPRLDLRTTGMEFASEMVIRAAKEKLDVRQFPIEYHPRGGESKLSSFRDGWRHLRFLLVHSPNYLFILPGAVMAAIGAIVELIVIARLGVFGREWDIHALIAGSLLAIVGHAGGCARHLRPRLRDVLHGRAGPMV